MTPRGGFGFGTVRARVLPPLERLPGYVMGCEVGVRVKRVWAPRSRRGVERRSVKDGRRVGEDAVEREAAVGAVDHFGGGG